MSQALAGIGSLLKQGDGASPEVFTTVSSVSSISGPSTSAETYDVTSHDTSGGYKSFIAGLMDGGEVTFDVFFNGTETTHIALDTTFQARTVRNWTLTPNGSTKKWAFSGVITKLDYKYPVNGPQTASCTIKVSGKPLFS